MIILTPTFHIKDHMRIPTAPNGLNLTHSIHDNTSLLARVVNYIRQNGPDTKVRILRNALGIKNVNTVRETKWGKYLACASRGYHSNMFRIAVAAGYLSHRRIGRTVLWELGTNAYKVARS